MNKNKLANFTKQYKNSICLTESLSLVKLLDFEPISGVFLVLRLDGVAEETKTLLIGLKDRIKDYNIIESRFHEARRN